MATRPWSLSSARRGAATMRRQASRRKACHLGGEHPESVWFLKGAVIVEPYTVGRWAAYGPWTSDAEFVGTKEQCLEYANVRAAALDDTPGIVTERSKV